ncbi:MAG: transposase [Nitrososphaerota archaeon]|nr:transposase [Nitrososphaerota archaeon]
MSQATVFEITQRVSQTLRSDYFAIRERIRKSAIVNIDETSIRLMVKRIGFGPCH